jgi:PAS domain S-box-containing protein
MKKCPNCGYQRRPIDDRYGIISAGECPKCRVIYRKMETLAARANDAVSDTTGQIKHDSISDRTPSNKIDSAEDSTIEKIEIQEDDHKDTEGYRKVYLVAENNQYAGRSAATHHLKELNTLRQRGRELERIYAEFRQDEAANNENEGRFKAIWESVQTGILITDSENHVIVDVNPAALRMIGASREEIIGSVCRQFIRPAEVGQCPVSNSGDPADRSECLLLTSGGGKRQIIKTAANVTLGGRTHLLESFVDITGRKQAEESLRKSEERFRLLAENAKDAIWTMDMDFQYTYLSPYVKQILDYTPEEYMAKPLKETMTAASVELCRQVFAEELEIEAKNDKDLLRSRTFEVDHLHRNGKTVPVEIKMTFIRNDDGQAIGILGYTRDITDRKQTEEMLRKSEEKFRFLAEHMNDNIFTMDMNLKTTYVSRSMEKLLGFTPEERMKQDIAEQVTPASMKLIEQILTEELKREQTGLADPDRSRKFEVEYYHKNGTTVCVENVISGIRDAQGVLTGIHGVSRDITERKEAEKALRESFERLRKVLGATVQAMALAVETRDPYTAGHQRRVADLARTIATEMGLSGNAIDGVRTAAIIHDLGKISVPSEILTKPTKLTDLEFGLIKTHAWSGYDILKDIDFPWPVARMVLEHHERMDGSGYPNGLKGEQLLLESRILAVADVVESMDSHRPYRPGLGIEKALEEIEKNRGILYDAEAVDACLKLFRAKNYTFPD